MPEGFYVAIGILGVIQVITLVMGWYMAGWVQDEVFRLNDLRVKALEQVMKTAEFCSKTALDGQEALATAKNIFDSHRYLNWITLQEHNERLKLLEDINVSQLGRPLQPNHDHTGRVCEQRNGPDSDE